MSYCMYYQATVDRARTWFFVAAIRSFEHVAFDRTFDVEQGIFEFFVPPDMESVFLAFMHYCEQEGIVRDLRLLPNRFQQSYTDV